MWRFPHQQPILHGENRLWGLAQTLEGKGWVPKHCPHPRFRSQSQVWGTPSSGITLCQHPHGFTNGNSIIYRVLWRFHSIGLFGDVIGHQPLTLIWATCFPPRNLGWWWWWEWSEMFQPSNQLGGLYGNQAIILKLSWSPLPTKGHLISLNSGMAERVSSWI